MGKVRRYLISAIIFFTVCIGMSMAAYADPDFASASAIGLETPVQGNVTQGYWGQQNIYKFSLSQPGGVTIQLKYPQQNSSDNYWDVYVYNASYKQLMSRSIPGNYTSASLPTIGLGTGQYYILIQSCSGSEARTRDIYTLTVHIDTSKNYESEQNEDYLTADAISVNTTYYGTVTTGYWGEKDCYRFELTSPGAVTLSFDHQKMNDSGTYWSVTLYDGSYQELCKRDIVGNNTSYSFPTIGLGAGTYYIQINSTSGSEARSSSVYALTARYQASSVWEKEKNDSYDKATPITAGKVYYGTTTAGYWGEKDYYKFSVTEGGVYTLTFYSARQTGTGTYYYVELQDSSYRKLSSTEIKGNKTLHTMQSTLSAGTYYVYVASPSGSSTLTESNYGFQIKKYVAPTTKDSTDESNSENTSKTATTAAAVGTTFTSGKSSTGIKYRVTSSKNRTVTVTGCGSFLKKVVIPSKVTYKGIAYNVTSVASRAFKKNKTITSVKIGKNVVSIGVEAFRGATNLKTAAIGSSVRSIGTRAFYNCKALKKIIIPKSVVSIGKGAFRKCSGLKTIKIKTTKLTASSVGAKAFSGTPANAKVTVPKSVLSAYRTLLRKKGLSGKATVIHN